MDDNLINFPDTTAETIMRVVESLLKRDGELEYITKYVDASPTYVKRAINFAIILNLIIKKDSEDTYTVTPKTRSLSGRFNENLNILFRESLFQYAPFIFVSSRIIKDDIVEIAIKKMKAVYGITTDAKTIMKVLNNFCRFIDLEDFSKDSLKKTFNLDNDLNTNKVIKILNNDFEINLFITEKLESECFNYIIKPERELLIKGLKDYTKDPSNAIGDVAGAFESFLRRVGKDKNINLDEFNGIAQVGQVLASSRNKILLPEHRNLCEFISTFRNPSSHKIQKNILEHWKINEDTSIEIILLCLSSIRSIYEYVFKKRLIL